MNINSQYLALLRNRVEESVSHPIKTSNDFIFLSGEIKGRINDSLGVTTLKRLWGYVEGYATIRVSTLDILCRFIGFPDWTTFVSDYCEVDSVQSSHRVIDDFIVGADCQAGDCIEVRWNPNRHCVFRCLGDSKFEVIVSENAKIAVGDRFVCDRFIKNQPLYISNLIHKQTVTALFVMGNKGGLTIVRKMRQP